MHCNLIICCCTKILLFESYKKVFMMQWDFNTIMTWKSHMQSNTKDLENLLPARTYSMSFLGLMLVLRNMFTIQLMHFICLSGMQFGYQNCSLTIQFVTHYRLILPKQCRLFFQEGHTLNIWCQNLTLPKLSMISYAHLWLLLFLQISLFIHFNLGPWLAHTSK